jgi:hypothetical protein
MTAMVSMVVFTSSSGGLWSVVRTLSSLGRRALIRDHPWVDLRVET